MSFSENLKLLLHDRNLKQADLCRMTGIQTSLISDYIGEKKSPTIGNAILIADALGTSLDALVGKTPPSTLKISENTQPFVELCRLSQSLPEAEQLLLLDVARTLKQRLAKSER